MTEEQALEKNNRINFLFDFYDTLLTEKQQNVIRYYFQDDYTLGEISALSGISRQAVYEHVKRAETVLEEYESKLHLLEKHHQWIALCETATKCIEQLDSQGHIPIKEQLLNLLQQMEQLR